jgi:hypothetical protein
MKFRAVSAKSRRSTSIFDRLLMFKLMQIQRCVEGIVGCREFTSRTNREQCSALCFTISYEACYVLAAYDQSPFNTLKPTSNETNLCLDSFKNLLKDFVVNRLRLFVKENSTHDFVSLGKSSKTLKLLLASSI